MGTQRARKKFLIPHESSAHDFENIAMSFTSACLSDKKKIPLNLSDIPNLTVV